MKTIDANTKIATLLEFDSGIVEKIITISPAFEQLKMPLTRQEMAARTTISMACKLGGCQLEDFFGILEPLGFTINRETLPLDDSEIPDKNESLEAIYKIKPENIIELDVREEIKAGRDPFGIIMAKVKEVKEGQMLKIINIFEPVPLINLLKKQGFITHTETPGQNLVYTYFYKEVKGEVSVLVQPKGEIGWDEVLKKYENKLVTINVQDMEMPMPMHTILEKLGTLPDGEALFVYHKRVPVFLISELEDLGYEYRTKEISDSEVHMLIYRKGA